MTNPPQTRKGEGRLQFDNLTVYLKEWHFDKITVTPYGLWRTGSLSRRSTLETVDIIALKNFIWPTGCLSGVELSTSQLFQS